jgi:hypothetical protein
MKVFVSSDNLKTLCMKTKLLLLSSLFSFVCHSQTPILGYFSNETPNYNVLTTATPFAQSASGANAVWDFNFAATDSWVTETSGTPTPAEIATYPTTAGKITVTGEINGQPSLGYMYFKEVGGVTYVTGGTNDGLELNYMTDNAMVGAFPLAYGYSNTDNIAGTYNNGTYAGTFTGTISFSVDAYGTIQGPAFTSTSVTRLKSIQTINIDYQPFGNVGTMVITTHSYYTNTDYPVLRIATTTTNVPLLAINDTRTRLDILNSVLLNRQETALQSDGIHIVPNPVKDVLNFQVDGNNALQSVSIYDLSGRLVGKSDAVMNSVDVSPLQAGTYLAIIISEKGTVSKKFIKQ